MNVRDFFLLIEDFRITHPDAQVVPVCPSPAHNGHGELFVQKCELAFSDNGIPFVRIVCA